MLIKSEGPLNLYHTRIDITDDMFAPSVVPINESPIDELIDLLNKERITNQ